MACATCSSGSPGGCQNNGHCATGGCNKMNTYDWLSEYDFEDPTGTDIIELSFKKGARKEFFRNHPNHPAQTKDFVVVDTGNGYDVGEVSLTGELVRLQLKKKRTKEQAVTLPVIRIANDRDLERLNEYRKMEKSAMIRARAISATLGLDMKVSDVEFRGDGRKATFYYTAEGRVDFRELVRLYAKEFQVKVEMRQIGARQEAGRIGGIGSCGRELCCSTWLMDFKSVNTHAARYQNLSINQAKLSGQCGRLKCCLNYELDTYMEAIEEFPQDVDVIRFQGGSASLIKMDIFKRLLYYSVEVERGRNTMVALPLERVKLIKDMNLRGQLPDVLMDPKDIVAEEEKYDFADVTGVIELPDHKKKRNKNKKKPGSNRDNPQGSGQQQTQQPQQRADKPRRDDNQQRPRRDDNQPRQHREGQPQKPHREGQQPKPDQPNQPQRQDPRMAKPTDGSAPQVPGKKKKNNRNRNRNRGPRPDGERPPQNPPAA
ncbi:MAG TPA: regulatory iron-sulfur-containing complex subunit RicT [Saprospiraceae bacterium]|nr:regulatory iron-sulfur-containing complex subunit RicT [Saprospiraceae bacterium]